MQSVMEYVSEFILFQYYSYPKKVTIEIVPLPVPFPAISLCNMRNLDTMVLNTLNQIFLNATDPDQARLFNRRMMLWSKQVSIVHNAPEILALLINRLVTVWCCTWYHASCTLALTCNYELNLLFTLFRFRIFWTSRTPPVIRSSTTTCRPSPSTTRCSKWRTCR